MLYNYNGFYFLYLGMVVVWCGGVVWARGRCIGEVEVGSEVGRWVMGVGD